MMQVSFELKLPTVPGDFLWIPYRSRTHADGRVNAGYKNIENEDPIVLPELDGFAELRELLMELRKTPFTSFRIDTGLNASPTHARPGYRDACFSFLTLVYRDLSRNTVENFEGLCRAIREYGETQQIANTTAIRVEVSAFIWRETGCQGLCMDLWTFGYGMNERLARDAWTRGIAGIQETVRRQPFLTASGEAVV